MNETLAGYIRSRAKELGLSLREMCRLAKISPQTFYSLSGRLPDLQTVVALADVLQVHPLRLLHLVFEAVPIKPQVASRHKRGDQSAFVRDVSIPDGALVLPGHRFTKTWELQNVGAVPWEGRYLQCMDEEIEVYNTRSGETLNVAHNLVPTTTRIAVPHTKPGKTVQLSVDFTAPKPPGTVLSYWKSVFADGSLCFPESEGVWVKVRVSTMTTGAFHGRGSSAMDAADPKAPIGSKGCRQPKKS